MEERRTSAQDSQPFYSPYSRLPKHEYHPFYMYKNLTLFTLLSLMILLVVLSIGYLTLVSKVNHEKVPPQNPSQSSQVVCTQDAKQCPDGSYVNRTAPNCEFASCPTSTHDRIANWKTYQSTNNKYIFDYPSDLSLEATSSLYLTKGPESNLSFLVEIAPETRYVSEREESFRDWAVKKFKELCLGQGPNGEAYCDKVLKETSFTNKYGLRGY